MIHHFVLHEKINDYVLSNRLNKDYYNINIYHFFLAEVEYENLPGPSSFSVSIY